MTSDALRATLILLGYKITPYCAQIASWSLAKDGLQISHYSESTPSYFVSIRGQTTNRVFHKEQQILNLINGDDYEYEK